MKQPLRDRGYLGSGGIARFRDALWASVAGGKGTSRATSENIAAKAKVQRKKIYKSLGAGL